MSVNTEVIVQESASNFQNMSVLQAHQIFSILSTKLGHANFRVDNYTLSPVSTKVGLMAVHLSLSCTIYDENSKHTCTHQFFVKKKIVNPRYQDFPSKVFDKEKQVYAAFGAINAQDINESIPKCFYIDDDHIVLSDLTSEEFTILPDQGYASDAQIRAVLKSLAQIHAAGIIYEEQQRVATGNPEFNLKDAFPDVFVELYITPFFRFYFAAAFKGIATAIRTLEMPETLSNGKRFLNEVQTLWRIYDTTSSTTYRNTFCHSDLWHANLFSKCTDTEHVAKIIDFQIMRYLPPAADVLLFLFANTSRSYRREHFETLLGEYFATFSTCFRNCNIDPDCIYTFAQFEESAREMELYANALNCLITPLVTVSNQEMDKLSPEERDQAVNDDRSVLLEKFKDNKYYMMRVKDVILQLRDLCEK